MATIRVLQAVSGLDFSWAPGELVDLDDEQAATWADGLRAELVDELPATDTPAPDEVRTLVVVDEDGRELEIVNTTREDAEAPADAPDGTRWVRWTVTVRLPATDPTTPDEDGEAFDPAEHSVKDVLAYLEAADEQEVLRVLQAEESAPTPRKGIVAEQDAVLARARERAAARGVTETAAEDSRGGGRGDIVETR